MKVNGSILKYMQVRGSGVSLHRRSRHKVRRKSALSRHLPVYILLCWSVVTASETFTPPHYDVQSRQQYKNTEQQNDGGYQRGA